MATAADLVEQVRQRLSPGQRPSLNKLAVAINSSVTTFTVAYDGISERHRLSIDLEDIYIWEATAATKTVGDCVRGFNGSTAASHLIGALVYDNAEFSNFEIVRAMNETLQALPGEGVFDYRTVDLTGSASSVGYNLTGVDDLLGVHRVRYEDFGGLNAWVTVNRDMWTVRQSMPTGDFAAGEALFLYDSVAPGQTLEVLYRAPFYEFTALADDLEDVGDSVPPASMATLLVVGAALRLTQGRPTVRARLDAQGTTRRPEEVTTNDTRSASAPLELEWQRALQRAKKEQLRRHGA